MVHDSCIAEKYAIGEGQNVQILNVQVIEENLVHCVGQPEPGDFDQKPEYLIAFVDTYSLMEVPSWLAGLTF